MRQKLGRIEFNIVELDRVWPLIGIVSSISFLLFYFIVDTKIKYKNMVILTSIVQQNPQIILFQNVVVNVTVLYCIEITTNNP